MSRSARFVLIGVLYGFPIFSVAQDYQSLAEQTRRDSQARVNKFNAAAKEGRDETSEVTNSTIKTLAQSLDRCNELARQFRQQNELESRQLRALLTVSQQFKRLVTKSRDSIDYESRLIKDNYSQSCSRPQTEFNLFVDCTLRWERMTNHAAIRLESELIAIFANSLVEIIESLKACEETNKNLGIMVTGRQAELLDEVLPKLLERVDRLKKVSKELM